MKICNKCKSERKEDEFYQCNKIRNPNYYDLICKFCRQDNAKINNDLIREWIDSIKKPCIICNESRNHVIDFHHLDPSKKDFTISKYASSGAGLFETKKKKIEIEIEKCITICANCHRDFHFLQKIKNIKFEDYFNNYKNNKILLWRKPTASRKTDA